MMPTLRVVLFNRWSWKVPLLQVMYACTDMNNVIVPLDTQDSPVCHALQVTHDRQMEHVPSVIVQGRVTPVIQKLVFVPIVHRIALATTVRTAKLVSTRRTMNANDVRVQQKTTTTSVPRVVFHLSHRNSSVNANLDILDDDVKCALIITSVIL
jgi:hypothetical protein